MKLSIANPTTGSQKVFDINDERKLRIFYEKRMSQEVPADALGDEFKGYVLKITGGNDKQGFAMMQGVLTNKRVRLLLSAKHGKLFRPKRDGQRKRKSVRGCIVDGQLSVLELVIVKKGEAEIPGLTDRVIPNTLGPKRASNIRKMFNLTKEDDVRKYVVRRVYKNADGTVKKTKAPKIQRLVTPSRLQRKAKMMAEKVAKRAKTRDDKVAYKALLETRKSQAAAATKA